MEDEKEEIKEIQETIIPKKQNLEPVSEEEIFAILKSVSPGTSIRTALDGALKIGKGALIVIENENIQNLLDGGFKVNCKFTPQKLMELTKMDGAIILSKDMRKIIHANVLLTPDSKIKSSETGTRHKAAERTAKQTSGFVIAISERKNEITLFYKNIKYLLKSTDEISRKTLGNIQILEKQRELFDRYVSKLDRSEIRNYPSLNHAVKVIQKGRTIQKNLRRYKKEYN
jgi:diadenylate cyclase